MFVKVWRNRRRSHQTVHDDLEMVAAQKTRPLFVRSRETLASSFEDLMNVVCCSIDWLVCGQEQ